MYVSVYVGQVQAISVSLAARERGISTEAMGSIVKRLVWAGKLKALPIGLDDRTPLYSYDELMTAIDARPGKGANLRRSA
jgi:hypothetical protein